MEREIFEFIRKNRLSPFSDTAIIADSSIFKTRDAKAIQAKILNHLSRRFIFESTKSIFAIFTFDGFSHKRQDFFRGVKLKLDNAFLKDIKEPKNTWKPNYSVLVATEDEQTFMKLKGLSCPVKLITSSDDVKELESYELVQALDCEEFSNALELLPSCVMLDSIEEVFLERHLISLSGWKNNFNILRENLDGCSSLAREISELGAKLDPLFGLMETAGKTFSEKDAEDALEKINIEVSNGLKSLTISGEKLYNMLSRNSFPHEVEEVIRHAISGSGLPGNLYTRSIPVSIDQEELEEMIKRQSGESFARFAEQLKKNSKLLLLIPSIIERISEIILYYDFISGLSHHLEGNYPEEDSRFIMEECRNLLLPDPQPVSFFLDEKYRCSILTGANSGGKTTLLEHAIQIITIANIGLPLEGKASIPRFTDVFYFAKTKGAASKGAFETLLSDMAKITPGKRTLILADEIEAVTEPGVAGSIISSTAEFFASQGCYLIIATHLGNEIVKDMPRYSRIDGIEAKGLDESFNLIIDHSPVMGKLANSTPELIIEHLAKTKKKEYYKFLYEKIRK